MIHSSLRFIEAFIDGEVEVENSSRSCCKQKLTRPDESHEIGTLYTVGIRVP